MLKPSLCDYSDAYILVNETINITEAEANNAAKQLDERNTGVIFKNCTTFTNCISVINITQVDNARDLDVVMPVYNLIQYSDNYSKKYGSLW